MSKLTAIHKALAAAFPEAVQDTEYAKKGYMLEVKVPAERIVEAVTIVDSQGFFIETITGVDWLGEKAEKLKEAAAKAAAKAKADAAEAGEGAPAVQAPAPDPVKAASLIDDLEIVYDFNHYSEVCRVVIKARVPRDNPEIPTISTIYPAAHWHERETHDFFGIKFAGHPYLVPLLLPEDADFHPLLKDFNK